jgi:hypothetical protein
MRLARRPFPALATTNKMHYYGIIENVVGVLISAAIGGLLGAAGAGILATGLLPSGDALESCVLRRSFNQPWITISLSRSSSASCLPRLRTALG